ncbi:MAG: PD40 domain-containing protein [Deltaproteobacteria bacterium]|nr:PD40 domain-containing protein [Deltaproteobacteria bacterium]
MSRVLFVGYLIVVLAGCTPSLPASEVPAESDAGIVMELERNIAIPVDGRLVQVTDMPGAEELESLSPDGTWVAFVSGTTGWAAVWAVPMPSAAAPRPTPIQLTNVGLENQRRTPGRAPAGFVPVPDSTKGIRWVDDRTVAWTSGGVEYRAEVPR